MLFCIILFTTQNIEGNKT